MIPQRTERNVVMRKLKRMRLNTSNLFENGEHATRASHFDSTGRIGAAAS